MPQTPRETAVEKLGEPVGAWINRHRKSAARLTYNQIARVLRTEHGIDVTAETVRSWHASYTAERAEPVEADVRQAGAA